MKKQYWLPFSALVLYPAFVLALTPPITTFNRTLKLGDHGSDVVGLQILLNRDPATKVAVVGPGSPGYESDYFGKRTAAAVAHFQVKYRNDILTPFGLVQGTGVVGRLTRAKLNSFAAAVATPTPPIASSSIDPLSPSTPAITASPSMTAPRIDSISPIGGGPDTVVTITGSGFESSNNTVYAGYTEFHGVAAADGKTMQVVINPRFAKFKDGPIPFPFWIYIKNSGGKSNNAVFTYQAP